MNPEPELSAPGPRLDLDWRVHTSRLLKEIADHSGQSIYRVPLCIFGQLLAQVGERAAVLNDPVLNALMVRLAIYTVADPESPDYDAVQVEEILRAGSLFAYCEGLPGEVRR